MSALVRFESAHVCEMSTSPNIILLPFLLPFKRSLQDNTLNTPFLYYGFNLSIIRSFNLSRII